MAADASTTTDPARQRRRRIGFAALAAVCVVGALAIGLSVKDKGKKPAAAAAKTDKGAFFPMADLLGGDSFPIVAEPVDEQLATPAAPVPATPVDPGTTFFDTTPSSGGDKQLLGEVTGALPGAKLLNGAFNTVAAQAAGLAGLRTCYVTTGPELELAMLGSNPCTVVMLTKGSKDMYITKAPMIVTTRKIVLGHPIDLPYIKGEKGVERVFDVHAGGNLDLRFVSVQRGSGRDNGDPNLRLLVGAVALVRLGGYVRATAAVFRDAPQTYETWYKELTTPQFRKRSIGGHILVLGGNFFCYGCQVIRWYPYGLPLINVAQIGRDFCVVAGNLVTVGSYSVTYQPYIATINIGNALAVLGGTGIRIGGGLAGSAVMVGQFGAGQNLFVGGGVLVNVGHQQQSVFLCMFRAGFGMSAVGAGVMVQIAELENRMWGVASINGAGQVYSVGAGVLHKTGGEVANGQVSIIQALVGGSAYLGAGTMQIVGEQYARVSVTQDQNGAGMTFFNGAGELSVIYVPSFVTATVRSQKILAAETFLGAGFSTNVNNTRWTYQVVNAGMPGYEGWVGLGAAVFIRSRTYAKRLVAYALPGRRFSWVVNGVGLTGGAIANKNIFVNKTGIYPLKNQPPSKPHKKHRLLAAVGDLMNSAATLGSGLLKGYERPSFTMANSALDYQRASPPNAGVLAAKLQSLVAATKHKRRLQGKPVVDPSRLLNFFAGLSPATLMEAWQEALEETNRANPLLAGGGRNLAGVALPTAHLPDAKGYWDEPVWVGGGKATQCVLCGVSPLPSADHWATQDIGNNTAATCHVSDACTGGQSFRDALATAAAQLPTGEDLILPPAMKYMASGSGSSSGAHSKYTRRLLQDIETHQAANPGEAIKMPDTNILSYDVSLYCQPKVGAAADCTLTQADLKAAFKAYMDEAAHEETAFQLAANTAAVHAALLDAVNQDDADFVEAVGAPASEDGCGKGLSFNVHFIAPDATSVDDLQAVLAAVVNDNGPLLAAINAQAAVAGAKQPFCGVAVRRKQALFFPATDTEKGRAFYQNIYTGNALDSQSLWPDVTLVSAHEVAPVQHAVAGQVYTILLEGFAMKSEVALQLFQGTEETGTVVATVPGGIGLGEVRKISFTAPEPALDGEEDATSIRAYLRAYHVGVPAIFAQSEVFELLPSSALDVE